MKVKECKKIFPAILSASFGFLVASLTRDSYLGILIMATTFLVIFLFKKFIFKK